MQEIPKFLKQEGDSLLFNEDNKEFVFFVSEEFFSNSGNAIAEIKGQYVSMIGLCNWAIIDSNGKRSKLGIFNFPTMFLCKPYKIEKVKGLKLDNIEERDYRLLRFRKGDEVVSQTKVPQLIDNVELFFILSVLTAKIPTTISYAEGWKLFLESMDLNGDSFGLNAQLFGILWAALCRDPQDISKPFRLSDMKDMNNYKPISIKMVPKFSNNLYQSLISEGWDESLTAAILKKDVEEDEIPYSPLEKIVMM